MSSSSESPGTDAPDAGRPETAAAARGPHSGRRPAATIDLKAQDLKAEDHKAQEPRAEDLKTSDRETQAASSRGPAAPSASSAGPDISAATPSPAGQTAGAGSPGGSGEGSVHHPAAAPVRGGVGVGGLIVAAIVGGAVALGGAYGLVSSGAVPLAATSPAPVAVDDGAATAAIAALTAKVAQLEQAVAVSAERTGVPETLTRTIDEVKAAQAAAEPRLEAAVRAADQAAASASEIGGRLQALEKQVAAADPAPVQRAISDLGAKAAANEAALTALSGKIDEVVTKTARAAGAESTAAASFALSSLERAATEGRDFTAELSLLADDVDDVSVRKTLEADAGAPPPSSAALVAAWPKAETAILATSVVPAGDGLLDKLMADAASLVTIRPSGPVEGSGTEAVVSRISADVKDGSLAAALTEWRALPAAAQTASQTWGADLARRVAIDDAVAKLKAAVLVKLGRAPAASNPSAANAPAAAAPPPAAN